MEGMHMTANDIILGETFLREDPLYPASGEAGCEYPL